MTKLYIHPVSKWQEANKAADGTHSFHHQDCYVDAHLSCLHNQQALVQRLRLPNSLQREKEVRCLQASGNDTQFISGLVRGMTYNVAPLHRRFVQHLLQDRQNISKSIDFHRPVCRLLHPNLFQAVLVKLDILRHIEQNVICIPL